MVGCTAASSQALLSLYSGNTHKYLPRHILLMISEAVINIIFTIHVPYYLDRHRCVITYAVQEYVESSQASLEILEKNMKYEDFDCISRSFP